MSSTCLGQKLDESVECALFWFRTGVAKQYPIRVVARMTGLSVDTLRAWERRYKVVSPDRSARGRLYDNADVHRFIQLRAAVGRGYAIGEVSALSDPELLALTNTEPAAPPARSTVDAVSGSRIDTVLAAVEVFDNALLNEELGRLAALLSPAEFVQQVALPLMREAGERWHAGTMQAAHEHMVTESIRNLLGTMARLNRPGEAQSKILATTPAGELHELGVMAAAMLAGVRGFPVAYLGPNLPADEILFAIGQTNPQVVLLGMTTPQPLEIACEAVRAVAEALPPGAELWLGGTGAQAVKLPEQPGIVYLNDFAELERNLTRIQSRGSRNPS